MASKRPMFLTAATLALGLLSAPGPLWATALEINSGPNIKTEFFRSGTGSTPTIPAPLSFAFALPDTATGPGLFEMFAGGDLNNLVDLISVTASATPLGSLNFPVTNPTFCDTNPAPAGCPVPETVPGGKFNATGASVIVEGRGGVSSVDFGTPGLAVPQALLVGGTTLTFTLTAASSVFDLYIDRLDLTYPSAAAPEPGSLALLGIALAGLAFSRRRKLR